MGWADVSTTVLPLVGVALGTTGALFGQFFVTRVEARREWFKIEEVQRQERKVAIVDFLAAVQQVERLEVESAAAKPVDSDRVYDALRELWLTKKVIELVCSAEAAQTAHDYAWEMNKNIHIDSLEATPDGERDRRIAFIETARRELGFDGEPLVRPGRPTPTAEPPQ